MQFVLRRGDVDYVNDSKATNVAAAIGAVRSVEGNVVLIAGGDGKGGNFNELARAIDGKLAGAVLIGTDAAAIAAALDDLTPCRYADDMDDAVRQASRLAAPGNTVLLAPACASLDQYANYGARGDGFIILQTDQYTEDRREFSGEPINRIYATGGLRFWEDGREVPDVMVGAF